MARFALQSPPDARFRQVTLPKTGLVGIGSGEALAASWGLGSGASMVAKRQTAGIAGKIVHSNTRIHRMKLFINSAFIGIVKSK